MLENTPTPPTTSGSASSSSLGKRLLIVVLFLTTTVLLVKYTVVGEWLNVTNMQVMVHRTGAWGYLIFVAFFTVAAIMNIPGTVFMILSIVLFGYWTGAVLSYFGGFSGAMATFYIGRAMGGQALSEIKNIRIRSLLQRAEDYPIRTLVFLRILVQLSPFIGYALALTKIKPRSYIIGNAISIIIPVIGLTIVAYFSEDLFDQLKNSFLPN